MRDFFYKLKPHLFWIVLGGIICAALAIRVYHIDLRPLHNDEGVNYFFFKDVRSEGYYKYSHENYHGPSYFYLSTFLTGPNVFGDSELGVRSSAIIAGIFLILLLIPLRRYEGKCFVLLAATLVAFSSSLVFYSRYAIHETLFLVAGAWLAFSLYGWWRSGKVSTIYQIGMAAALLIATKETFIITLFCVGLAFLSLGDYRKSFYKVQQQWQHILASLLLMSFIIVLIFTGGFRWMGGLREMFLAVPQWVGRNTSDVGHFKSFWYYCEMLFGPEPRELMANLFDLDLGEKIHLKTVTRTEFQLVLIVIIPLIGFLLKYGRRVFAKFTTIRSSTSDRYPLGDTSFFRFCLVWGLSALLVYSYVDYKTPWLVINITYPLIIALAWLLAQVVKVKGVAIGSLCIIPAILISIFLTWKYNFKYPYGDKNPYSYTHTSQGMIDVVEMIDNYRKKVPNPRILIGVGSYWPLPYYLRHYSVLGYEHTKEPEKRKNSYDVMIVDSKISWKDPEWTGRYRRLSDVQEAHVYFKNVR